MCCFCNISIIKHYLWTSWKSNFTGHWLIISRYVLFCGRCDLHFNDTLPAETHCNLIYAACMILHFLLKHSRSSIVLGLIFMSIKNVHVHYSVLIIKYYLRSIFLLWKEFFFLLCWWVNKRLEKCHKFSSPFCTQGIDPWRRKL